MHGFKVVTLNCFHCLRLKSIMVFGLRIPEKLACIFAIFCRINGLFFESFDRTFIPLPLFDASQGRTIFLISVPQFYVYQFSGLSSYQFSGLSSKSFVILSFSSIINEECVNTPHLLYKETLDVGHIVRSESEVGE